MPLRQLFGIRIAGSRESNPGRTHLICDPLRVSAETAFVTLEHLRGFFVSLQLPVQPGKRDFAESTAKIRIFRLMQIKGTMPCG
jgi:hypothetical protein